MNLLQFRYNDVFFQYFFWQYKKCSYICIANKLNRDSMVCRNFVRGESLEDCYCKSTHVCYKPCCFDGDLFLEACRLYHGYMVPLDFDVTV